jgi:CRISPR/Cas system-associated exonuclease Cas4 (RecB family)
LISGRSDAIISDGKDLYVVDIKSMNSMIFKNLDEPKEENVDQIQLYLHYFKIPKGILLYVNKDNQQLKEFVINYDKNRASCILETLSEIKKKIESNVIPDRLSNYPDNWQCKYCQFREICDMINKGEIQWEDFKKRIESREQNLRTE